MNYNVRTGLVAAGGWSAALVSAMVYFACNDDETDFLALGPSGVRFGGFVVNTWPRWGIVMAYSTLSQVAYSVVSSTISPYISNVIKDHKTPLATKGSVARSHAIVQAYTLYHWIASVFDVFLWITMQLQYILPAVVVDLVCTAYFTRAYFRPEHAESFL